MDERHADPTSLAGVGDVAPTHEQLVDREPVDASRTRGL
jgi:hypothetical protein